VQPCACARTGGRPRARRRDIHEPRTRPPRLPSHGRALLRGQGRVVHPGALPTRGRRRRRRVWTATARRGDRAGHVLLRLRLCRAVVGFAHPPGAVGLLLDAVRPLVAGRVLLVLGCGGARDPYKRPLMGAAAVRGADLAVLTTDSPRSEDPLAILDAMTEGA